MEEVIDALRAEEALLQLLLFKLVETRLLLRAGAVGFVWRSTVEVQTARRQAERADRARAAVVDALRPRSADARATTLRALAGEATEPWARMLRDHHESMSTVVAEIEMVAHHNAGLAREGLLLHDEQGGAGGSGGGVTALLTHADDAASDSIGDECGYHSVAGAADGLRMPALLAFLR